MNNLYSSSTNASQMIKVFIQDLFISDRSLQKIVTEEVMSLT